MNKKLCVLAVAFVLMLSMPSMVKAESGKTLIEKSTSFDSRIVSLRGEVIGVLMRGSSAWVNVLDKGFAVGVWCRAEDAEKVSFIGDYKNVGDTVEVIGTFHMACSEHGGDLDIHAENFTILTSGRSVDRVPNLPLTALSIVFVAAAIYVALWVRRRRIERGRRHYLFEG